MINHKPATPLPWTANPYLQARDGIRERNREQVAKDDAYELHAANAYPRLVEKLKHVTNLPDDFVCKSVKDSIRALLKEQGEL